MKKKIVLNPEQLLHPSQYDTFKKLTRFSVIVCGRRFGKTRLAAFKILTSAIKKVGVYYWITPTFGVGLPAWRLMKRFVKATFGEKGANINESLRVIYLPNESIIEFKSADNPDSLRGEGLSGVVFDECAQIRRMVWTQSVRPALSDLKGWAVFIGTPKGRANLFWDLYDKAKREGGQWSCFNHPSSSNPLLDPKELEDVRKDISEREYSQEYLAEFLMDSGKVYKREWFNNRQEKVEAIARWISWDTASTVNVNSAYSAGIVFELTSDYRVFVKEVVRKKLEFPQLQNEIDTLAEKYNQDELLKGIIIENKSSGISVLQSLRQTSNNAHLLFGYNPTGKKIERGYISSKFMEKDCIVFPLYNDENKWLFDFEEELLSFGETDDQYFDQCDAFSMGVDYLSHYLSAGLESRRSEN